MKENIQFLVIDLFCGAGGTTTGIENARDANGNKIAKVIACVNHDEYAIKSHAANHPDTLHFVEDIRTLDLIPLCEHVRNVYRKYPTAKIVLWASLECTNFSKAKGGLPRDADSRTLANDLFRYINLLYPDYIMIENVEEFMSWGPLNERGRPISRKNGIDFVKWCNRVQSHGFNINHDLLNSANYGAYTSRKRLFIIFSRPGIPNRMPKPTHSKKPTKDIFGELKPWKPVREVLDFEDEGQSIFTRKKPLVERTLMRIYAGLEKYVANGEKVFLSKAYSGDPKSKNISVDAPAATITPKDHHQLIESSFIVKYLSNNAKTGINAGADVNKPAPTITTQGRLGLCSCNFITNYYGNGHNTSIDGPASTLRTKDGMAKVQADFWLDKQYSGSANHQSINVPSGAMTGKNHYSLMRAEKIHYLVNPQYQNGGSSIEKPCFTLIARMDKAPPYLVATEKGQIAIQVNESDNPTMIKIKQFMAKYGIFDIKMRMLRVMELKRITGFPDDYVLNGGKTRAKKFIGNAVVPVMAQRIIEANI